jgi:hypothetical protein
VPLTGEKAGPQPHWVLAKTPDSIPISAWGVSEAATVSGDPATIRTPDTVAEASLAGGWYSTVYPFCMKGGNDSLVLIVSTTGRPLKPKKSRPDKTGPSVPVTVSVRVGD